MSSSKARRLGSNFGSALKRGLPASCLVLTGKPEVKFRIWQRIALNTVIVVSDSSEMPNSSEQLGVLWLPGSVPASTSQSLAPAKGGMIQFQSNGNILQK